MRENERNGVIFYTFELFEKYGIKHCFSSRRGGVSEGEFSSLNLGYGRGDSDANVAENFRRICAAGGFDGNNLARTGQVHGVSVARVFNEGKPQFFPDTDGMTTNAANVPLATFYADCTSLFFYDIKERAIALSHAGWRGAIAGMARVTVEKMAAEYGSRPENIIAGIGPCICEKCFEVDFDVSCQFMPKFEKFIRKNDKKYHIDLRGVNRSFMLEAGIKPENIETAPECTMCDPENFYSHRRDGTKRGSLAGLLQL